MNSPSQVLVALFLPVCVAAANAATPDLAPGSKTPILRLEAEGPTAYVTSLAFTSDGKTLYAAGWDKIVRAWRWGRRGLEFDPRHTYRVPIGPGRAGWINAMALSDDDRWLAVGGVGVSGRLAGYYQSGYYFPLAHLEGEEQEQLGLIYVFDRVKGTVQLLRAHRGAVCGLVFAPTVKGKPPRLISASELLDAPPDRHHISTTEIRVWEIQTKPTSHPLPGARGKSFLRPGLAAWYSTEGQHLYVAATWADSSLRIWNADTATLLSAHTDGRNNVSLLARPNVGDLLTAATFGRFPPRRPDNEIHLNHWPLGEGKEPLGQLDTMYWPVLYASPNPVRAHGLALLCSKPNGPQDLAAVLVSEDGKEDVTYSLQLHSLYPDRFGALLAKTKLWQNKGASTKQLIMAASPDGQYLAVAGNVAHDIRLYAVSDLRKLKATPRQVLRGSGLQVRGAVFARREKDKDDGLLLEIADPATTEPARPFVFHFAGRRLTTDRAGWLEASPDVGPWRLIAHYDSDPPSLTVLQGEKVTSRIWLPRTFSAIVKSVLPPGPGRKTPIVAIAGLERGVPRLGLYNGTTGEQFRELIGHHGRISSLAFSNDGRLLVSTSDDQTVAIWSLIDINDVLGKHGGLIGLPVKSVTVGGRRMVAVRRSEEGGHADSDLAPEEFIEAIVHGRDDRPMATAREFYRTLLGIQPGEMIRLRVRNGQQVRIVPRKVDQAIDERKPLFTLFFPRPRPKQEQPWIGWSPVGPYDASDLIAEGYAGWHFNTGLANEPTNFAVTSLYHPIFYAKGVLGRGIKEGRIPPKRREPLPRPTVGLWLEDPRDPTLRPVRNHWLVRHDQVKLWVNITGRSLDTLTDVTWRLDQERTQKFDLLQAHNSHSFSVDAKLPRSGKHRFTVTARTPEGEIQEYSQDLYFSHHRLPPIILTTSLWDKGGDEIPVKNVKEYRVTATVQASENGGPFTVHVRSSVGGALILDRSFLREPGKPVPLAVDVPLRSGTNLIEIQATNKGADSTDEDQLESASAHLRVVSFQKAVPPRIAITALEPLSPDNTPQRGLPVIPGGVVVVDTARVRLLGKVASTDQDHPEPVQEISWTATTVGDHPMRKHGKIRAGKKIVAISQELQLQPGKQTVSLSARTKTSDTADFPSFTLDYRPPAPDILILTPTENETLIRGETRSHAFTIEGRIRSESIPTSCHAEVLVDDVTLSHIRPRIDRLARTVTAHINLDARVAPYRLQLRLRNSWRTGSLSQPKMVTYCRPPSVVELAEIGGQKIVANPTIDLKAKIRSVIPGQQPAIEVEVNGQKTKWGPVTFQRPEAPGMAWEACIRRVVLDAPAPPDELAKLNRIRVVATNAEGKSVQTPVVKLMYRPGPLAEITFLEPDGKECLYEPHCDIHLRVRSRSRVTEALLHQEPDKTLPQRMQKLDKHVKLALAKAPTTSDAWSEWDGHVRVDLAPGSNTFLCTVTNAAGPSGRQLQLNLVPKPVWVYFDSLESLSRRKASVSIYPNIAGKREQPRFQTLPSAHVQLHGHIDWNDQADGELTEERKTVRVYVNGFQQVPGQLVPHGHGGRWDFDVNLILNERKNKIVVLLAVQVKHGCPVDFDVLCPRPDRYQRLHLVIVSQRAKDKEKLAKEFHRIFPERPHVPGTKQATGWDEVDMYDTPLVGDEASDINQIQTQLRLINPHIEARARGNSGSDIVLFFYQGPEKLDQKRGNLLFGLESLDQGKKYRGLECDWLVRNLAETPGAHLLFLDVNRLPGDGVDHLEPFQAHQDAMAQQDTAVLRYAWLNPPRTTLDKGLLEALQQAMPKGTRLVELTKRIRELVAAAATPKAQFYPYVESMPELQIISPNP